MAHAVILTSRCCPVLYTGAPTTLFLSWTQPDSVSAPPGRVYVAQLDNVQQNNPLVVHIAPALPTQLSANLVISNGTTLQITACNPGPSGAFACSELQIVTASNCATANPPCSYIPTCNGPRPALSSPAVALVSPATGNNCFTVVTSGTTSVIVSFQPTAAWGVKLAMTAPVTPGTATDEGYSLIFYQLPNALIPDVTYVSSSGSPIHTVSPGGNSQIAQGTTSYSFEVFAGLHHRYPYQHLCHCGAAYGTCTRSTTQVLRACPAGPVCPCCRHPGAVTSSLTTVSAANAPVPQNCLQYSATANTPQTVTLDLCPCWNLLPVLFRCLQQCHRHPSELHLHSRPVQQCLLCLCHLV